MKQRLHIIYVQIQRLLALKSLSDWAFNEEHHGAILNHYLVTA